MNKEIKLGIMYNEGEGPDFGTIQQHVLNPNNLYLLARDIPKLNGMLTRATSAAYLPEGQSFNFYTGALAYVVDYKTAGSGKIYMYHRGKDYWYEFNIRSDLGLCELMWNRHETILRKTKTISGTPPLTFKSNGRPLKNYRIYGNTVNGESVGDLVMEGEYAGKYCIPVTISGINMFDGLWQQGYWALTDGSFNYSTTWICSLNKTPCSPSTYYTFKYFNNSRYYSIGWYDINEQYISMDTAQIMDDTGYRILTAISPNNAAYMTISIASYPSNLSNISPDNVSLLMLNVGNTSLQYEPYHRPETVKIYIDTPLAKTGAIYDYIDFSKQKQYNANGTIESISISKIPTLHHSNILLFETTVQPSAIEIKGVIEEIAL